MEVSNSKFNQIQPESLILINTINSSWKCNYYYKTKCPAIVIVDEITECFESQHEHQHDPSLAPPKKEEKRDKSAVIISTTSQPSESPL